MALYLGIPDRSGIYWASFPWWDIRNYLLSWLGSCCGDPKPVSVRTVGAPPRLGPLDALVYLVGYWSDSVAARVGAPQSAEIRAGMTTSLNGDMISEVYVNALKPYGVAATVYHELLHNKFRLAVDIHRTPDGNFTSATAPYWEGGPSGADQALMCQALALPSRQFVGGF